jgi:hypothetical protein
LSNELITTKTVAMKTVTERKRFPLIAGMRLDGTGDNKMKKVGYYIVEFTYILHPDGDKQLISDKRIKSVVTV